jgi:transposase-like protein
MTKKRVPPFPAEVRERAVRMAFEQEREHATQWTAICSVAGKIGCSGETLRNWVRRAERDQELRPGPTTPESERVKALEACGLQTRIQTIGRLRKAPHDILIRELIM